MHTEVFFQKMNDGAELSVSRLIPDRKIKAVVQFSHGMAEYASRYERFGTVLANNGYVFSIHDHRGHGKTAEYAEEHKSGMFGYLADKDGFDRVVQDLYEVIGRLRSDFPGKKVILIGHSFGSFVAQSFMEAYGKSIDSCILCGTAGPRPVLTLTGQLTVSLFVRFCGKKYRSPAMEKITFGSYNKRIENPVQEHAWLSRDASVVERYENDSWCGFTPTLGFFSDMIAGLCLIHTGSAIGQIPRTLPVLILCGDADPVGNYGASVLRLYRTYRKAGIKTVGLKMYPGARHELLNETNRDEVVFDIQNWMEQVLSGVLGT